MNRLEIDLAEREARRHYYKYFSDGQIVWRIPDTARFRLRPVFHILPDRGAVDKTFENEVKL